MTPLVILLSVFGAALAAAVILLRRAIHTRDAEEKAADFAAYWESVAQMLDQDPGLDEVGLRRAMRAHPAGKGRKP
ncbi:MAG: hypothetical protein J2P16_07220 [Mycobacterium sp.]|nr:hypothetical protein [Mycobacterium sp.]